LTIKEQRLVGNKYYYDLTYPNLEIKMSLTDSILGNYVDNEVARTNIQEKMYEILAKADLNSLENEIKKIYASIPNDWFRKNNIPKYEGYYCIVLYCYFCGMGLDTKAEETTSKGRIDMTVKLDNNIYIIEFKTEKSGKKPLDQIKEKNYAEKFIGGKENVYLVGIEFDEEKRNVSSYEWEKVV